MKQQIIAVNEELIDTNPLLFTLFIEIFEQREDIFNDSLKEELLAVPTGGFTTELLTLIETRLRNQREQALLRSLDKIATFLNMVFDYHAAIQFMEKYLTSIGAIRTINFNNEVYKAACKLYGGPFDPQDPTLGTPYLKFSINDACLEQLCRDIDTFLEKPTFRIVCSNTTGIRTAAKGKLRIVK